jgi:TatD DNase family protein
MLEITDSHCHLHYEYEGKSTSDLIREAHDKGVSRLITVGVAPEMFAAIEVISEANENVWHTIGIHPHDVQKISSDDLDKVRQFGKHPKCVAIGELGLDYYYEHSDRKAQMDALLAQLEIAVELGKPIIVHGRDAEEDLLAPLVSFARNFRAKHPGRLVGVLHCFTGTYAFSKACVDEGFLTSFSGIITFKNAGDIREVASRLPIEKLMVETDSPYLAPIPYRGKKCEPSMVVETAKKLAEIKGLTLEELARHTTANAKLLFGI